MGKKPNKFRSGEAAAESGGELLLAADVAKFAASLGLSGGGAAPAADFDDFAPELASKRLGGDGGGKKTVKKEKKAKGKNTARNDGDSAAAEDEEGVEEKAAGGRDWNFGAGPRPASVSNALAVGVGNLDEEGCWHLAAASLAPLPGSGKDDGGGQVDDEEMEALMARAEKLEEGVAAKFTERLEKRNSAEARWLQLSRQSGTTSDKVAAMTLLVQESAAANMRSLDTLLKWCSKKSGGRDVVAKTIDALRELFVRSLLPDRKLRLLVEQSDLGRLPPNRLGNAHLLYWHIEDCVKRRYALFVEALEECSRDNLEFVKEKAVKAAYELLRSKPEAEARLLSLVVNKLGDPSRKLASKAGYLLLCILDEHPGMKGVLVREVERFVFRPNLQARHPPRPPQKPL